MKKKLTAWLIVTFMIFQTCVFAQEGEYFMTHYQPDSELFDNTNFDILQDNRGVIYIANRSGLLRFDGHNWEGVKTPGAIFSLALDPNSNTVYCGGLMGFGKFSVNSKNSLEYVSLLDSSAQEAVYQVVLENNKLLGLTDDDIVTFDIDSKSIERVESKYSGEIFKLLKSKVSIYTSTEKSGLMLIAKNQLKESGIKQTEPLDIEFLVDLPNDEGQLLGTSTNSLLINNNGKITNILIDSDYLLESEFIDAVYVAGSQVAIATLKGGVIFIDYKSKKVEQIINYQSGLPDNEIYAIAKDSNGGIWAAHSSGLTRISPQLPFRLFSNYEGLEGNILATVHHNGSLYVGTNEGLFYLKKIKEYEEKQVFQKEKVMVETQVNQPQERKKGLLGLFKKKRKINTDSETITKSEEKIIYRKRTKKQLKSTSYKFFKIPEIESKMNLFSKYNGSLFAAGTDGIFQINGQKAVEISSEPMKHFAISKHSKLILGATLNDEIYTFSAEEDFQRIELFDDYRDNIQYIFEGINGRIWLTSDDEIFYVDLEDWQILETEIYPISNPYLFNTLGAISNNGTYFINETGLLSFSEDKNTMNTIDASYARYLTGEDGKVWVFDGEKWSTLGDKSVTEKNLLNVFENLKYISTDTDNYYWVVTDKNEVVRIGQENKSINEAYDLYLRNIVSGGEVIDKTPKLQFEQSNNAIVFEFAQPEFSGVLNFKYQYKLEGLTNEWSQWSKDNFKLVFNYLPEGSFTLKVRSKDALGNSNEIEPITFKIVPPYWKRPWFYAFEFSALALLLFVSVRLKGLGFRYRLASRLLALITLIIIIEFIQTVAENEFAGQSSPVFDFIVQVSIAIIVLPVESLIRKYIFREKNVQILDFVQLKNKGSK